jgi:ribosome-associated protein
MVRRGNLFEILLMVNERAHRTAKIGDRPINLTQLLKLAGCVQSGGEAKSLIAGGRVRVNGEIEIRKRRQMSAGDVVLVEDGPIIDLSS